MSIVLIRHGLTQGNLEGRYIGCKTDEPLCEQGIAQLESLHMPEVRYVFTSPMKRCIQSARILYPGLRQEIVPDFRECDFGDFEGKNYAELNGSPAYQAWIDSGGEFPFPNGESRQQFAQRSVRAFQKLNLFALAGDCALAVHGGTVMAIMEACARPCGQYFDFQLKCGQAYLLHADGSYCRVQSSDRKIFGQYK